MDREIELKKISEHFNIPLADLKAALLKKATKPRGPRKGDGENKPIKPNTVLSRVIKEKLPEEKKKYFFLKKDYMLLLKKMERISEEIQRLGEEIGESCSDSETFHDNFDYEEGGRQQRMWVGHIGELQKM